MARGIRGSLRGARIVAAAILAASAARSAAETLPVTRLYSGVVGAHGSVEVSLTFAAGAVTGWWRPADGGPQSALEGRSEAGRLELQVLDESSRPVALLSCLVPRGGVLRGLWQAGGRKLVFGAQEVANDAPAAQPINGHYARQGSSSGGALDLLLLDDGRVKVQAYALWAGAGGAALAGDLAGYAAFDGRAVRLAGRERCVLTIEPVEGVEGALEVKQEGPCGAAFSGRYLRRSPVVPDWETFRWVTE